MAETIPGSTSVHPDSVTGNPSFDYAAGQPNLFRMMKAKQTLHADYGLEPGFEKFKENLTCIGIGLLEKLSIGFERDFARMTGVFYRELKAAGEQFSTNPLRTIGKGTARTERGVTRTEYITCLTDVKVRGRSEGVIAGSHFLLDYQDDEPDRLDDELEWDPAIFAVTGKDVWIVPARNNESPIGVTQAFSLLGAHTDFFGHWICEYLPKLMIAFNSGLLPVGTTILIDSHMPPSHKESLVHLLGGQFEILEIPPFREAKVQRLWRAPGIVFTPLHEKRNEKFSFDSTATPAERFRPVLQSMRTRMDSALKAVPPTGKRVFFARKEFRHRKLVNASQLEECAKQRDFTIIYPEDHTFLEQANFARSADVVLATEGSAIFLACFMKPGGKLIILCHPLVEYLTGYNAMFSPLGIDTCVMVGPINKVKDSTPQDSDYFIDPQLFVESLEAEMGAT